MQARWEVNVFIDQGTLNKILQGDLEAFNKVLEDVSIKSVETTLRSIPVMIGKLLQVTSATQELVKSVYDTYPEFKDCKELVALTIQETEAQNPGLDFKAVVDKAIPVIKAKIAEFNRLANSTTGQVNVEDIEKRLNGAI